MDLFDSLKGDFEALRDQYLAARSDGKLSWDEVCSLLASTAKAAILEAEKLAKPGVEKKELVMAAIEKAYDLSAALIDVPLIPETLERMAENAIKPSVLKLCDKFIEEIVSMLPAPAA